MFWACIQYSDGTRIHHVFKRCLFYVTPRGLHICGDAVCGISFSHDTSGSRVDVTDGLAYGFEPQTAPLDECQQCRRAALKISGERAKALIWGPVGDGN